MLSHNQKFVNVSGSLYMDAIKDKRPKRGNIAYIFMKKCFLIKSCFFLIVFVLKNIHLVQSICDEICNNLVLYIFRVENKGLKVPEFNGSHCTMNFIKIPPLRYECQKHQILNLTRVFKYEMLFFNLQKTDKKKKLIFFIYFVIK